MVCSEAGDLNTAERGKLNSYRPARLHRPSQCSLAGQYHSWITSLNRLYFCLRLPLQFLLSHSLAAKSFNPLPDGPLVPPSPFELQLSDFDFENKFRFVRQFSSRCESLKSNKNLTNSSQFWFRTLKMMPIKLQWQGQRAFQFKHIAMKRTKT